MFDMGVTLGSRYLLEALVARGGMGEVWSARDVVLDRRVAVKVLLPNLAGDPGFTARFRAEARAIAVVSIVMLSPEGSGTPRSQPPVTSPSAGAVASSPSTEPSPDTATGLPTPGTPTRAASTARPANPDPSASGSGPPAGNPSTPATTARVPFMYGWKENEMKAEMARLGLVERIRYEWTPDKCYVIEQTPAGGTMVPIGSTVDVVIARATGQCLEV